MNLTRQRRIVRLCTRLESIIEEIDRLSDDEEAQGEKIMAMKRAKRDADFSAAGKAMNNALDLAGLAFEIEGVVEGLEDTL
ncbi:MAG: hypothetical protein ACK4UQ_06700 [Brevundimonas sp.]